MSWKVVLVIFLIFLFLGIWIDEQGPHVGLLLSNTVIFVIVYHLLITLPSVILYNFENKYLKILIHFLVLIVLFSVVIVFIGIPMYEGMQKEEEKFRKMNQSVQQDIREEKTSSNDVISLAWNQCGGQLWKVQISITPIDSYRVVITKYACTKGGEYIDGQFYEDGKPSKPYPGMEGYSYSGQITDSDNNVVVDFIGGGDELSIVDTPEGFPLLTTKKVLFPAVVHELLWFIRGATNINDNLTQHTPIWDAWAAENGDLGPIYGYQWRKWERYRPDELGNLKREQVDQLAAVIKSIKENPDSRRHIVSAWNVADLEDMALPPCHSFFQFYVCGKHLDCQ